MHTSFNTAPNGACPDLTKAERERARALREELQNRRKNGEQDLTIRNGRIVVMSGTDEKYREKQQKRQQLRNTDFSSGTDEKYKEEEKKRQQLRNTESREDTATQNTHATGAGPNNSSNSEITSHQMEKDSIKTNPAVTSTPTEEGRSEASSPKLLTEMTESDGQTNQD